MSNKSIVITGCSSGFGRVTALELARLGWLVFATVRKEEDRLSLLAEAESLGCQDHLIVLLCDITQTEQISMLAQQVEEKLPGDQAGQAHLHALLNNAGTAYGGPLELISLADLRAQLEINVIAQLAMIQALLPLLKAGRGTIINVSSINGRISTPVTGAYAASKFALEAISDALRVELAPFNVQVVVVEPTSSPTAIWKTSVQRSLASLEAHRSGSYARLLTVAERSAARSSKEGFPPQIFASTIVHILTTARPRARYPVPASAGGVILLRRFMPDRLWDRMVRRTLKW